MHSYHCACLMTYSLEFWQYFPLMKQSNLSFQPITLGATLTSCPSPQGPNLFHVLPHVQF